MLIIEELYDALVEAGASEDKARSAARTVANYESRLSKIDTDLSVLKWMVGTAIAIGLAILFRVYH